jgi:hypothetical protein
MKPKKTCGPYGPIYLSVLVIFTIVKIMSLRKPSFFIIRVESIRKYVCRVYHQLLQYIAVKANYDRPL